MLTEFKDKSQVTIPKAVVNELGLSKGDLFEVLVDHGSVRLVPVVVYPKDKANELEALAAIAREERGAGSADVYDDVEDLIADLHKAV
jgi:AbrB family looped-hinge helix DNA binding protein